MGSEKSSPIVKLIFFFLLLVVVAGVGYFVYDYFFVLSKGDEEPVNDGERSLPQQSNLPIDPSQNAIDEAFVMYTISGRIEEIVREAEGYKFLIRSHDGVVMDAPIYISDEEAQNIQVGRYEGQGRSVSPLLLENFREDDPVQINLFGDLQRDVPIQITQFLIFEDGEER